MTEPNNNQAAAGRVGESVAVYGAASLGAGSVAAFLEKASRTLSSQPLVRKVILFGSFARGEQTARSDIDLLVVEEGEFGPKRSRRKEMVGLRRLLAEAPTPVDVLVYSETEWEQWKNVPCHVIGAASRDGKVLYEQP
jgi:predicted nucleotidyltransferase